MDEEEHNPRTFFCRSFQSELEERHEDIEETVSADDVPTDVVNQNDESAHLLRHIAAVRTASDGCRLLRQQFWR